MNGADCLRVGIYGGTFAPVHNGHVEAAKAFMEQMKLDYLFIIPTCIPPHKQIDFVDEPLYRLRMCELAFEKIDGVVISDMEIARGGTSYTYDTLKELTRPNTHHTGHNGSTQDAAGISYAFLQYPFALSL